MGALAFQRTGVVFLLLGMILGMKMGMTEDFTLAPVHTHLNLAGGVLMFVAGLFYAQRPEVPRWAVTTHYWLHLAGAILLVAGIFGAVTHAPWYGGPRSNRSQTASACRSTPRRGRRSSRGRLPQRRRFIQPSRSLASPRHCHCSPTSLA